MPLSRSTAEAGTLVLVVGPSGAGKDTLLNAAKGILQSDQRFLFVQREITRAQDAGGEDHSEVSVATFEDRVRAGEYFLSWRAHGLGYGIPATIKGELAGGRVVIVNASRGIIPDAMAAYARTRVCHVTTHPDILRARLLARGRESGPDIEARVDRARSFSLSGNDIAEIRNDGSIDEAVSAFLAFLRSC